MVTPPAGLWDGENNFGSNALNYRWEKARPGSRRSGDGPIDHTLEAGLRDQGLSIDYRTKLS